jgi:Meiotically Up-regulated Gene 113 (MUG113) protein
MPWLYGIQSGLFIKVGVAKNITTRLRQMNLYNPHPCKVVAKRNLPNAYQVEKRMHQVLAPYAIGREWFLIDVSLVRAAMTVVIKEVDAAQRAWIAECARKAADRESARGLPVENKTAKIILLRKQVNS